MADVAIAIGVAPDMHRMNIARSRPRVTLTGASSAIENPAPL
jgi:hypothetical protein